MNLSQFRQMSIRYWNQQSDKHFSVSAEAQVVTGLSCNDALFHYMIVDNGVEMVLEQESVNRWRLIGYRVVDEKKFNWFVLRWS